MTGNTQKAKLTESSTSLRMPQHLTYSSTNNMLGLSGHLLNASYCTTSLFKVKDVKIALSFCQKQQSENKNAKNKTKKCLCIRVSDRNAKQIFKNRKQTGGRKHQYVPVKGVDDGNYSDLGTDGNFCCFNVIVNKIRNKQSTMSQLQQFHTQRARLSSWHNKIASRKQSTLKKYIF